MNKPHIYAAQFAAIQKTRDALNAIEAGAGDEYFRSIDFDYGKKPWLLSHAFDWVRRGNYSKWSNLSDKLDDKSHYKQFKDLREIRVKP